MVAIAIGTVRRGGAMSAKRPKRKDRPGVEGAGRTPLHYAAAESNVEQVRQLLESGGNVDAATFTTAAEVDAAAKPTSERASTTVTANRRIRDWTMRSSPHGFKGGIAPI